LCFTQDEINYQWRLKMRELNVMEMQVVSAAAGELTADQRFEGAVWGSRDLWAGESGIRYYISASSVSVHGVIPVHLVIVAKINV